MPTTAKYVLDLRASHTQYRNAEGKRLPGVTTILGVLNKPALLEWAARVEREYMEKLRGAPPLVEYAYAVQRDTAADVGSVAHARIHASLRGLELDEEGLPAEAVDKSMNAWVRFDDWWRAERFSLVVTEQPMVSERWQIGGTLDIVAESPEGLTLCDVKSSKPHPKWPWDEVIAQVAAYRMIWNELNPLRPIVRACSYRCGKEEADSGQVAWFDGDQMAAGGQLFMAALDAYRAKAALERAR
jgi:hypothetical protein